MKMNPSQEMSPIGHVMDELHPVQTSIPNDTHVTPQQGVKKPAKSILKSILKLKYLDPTHHKDLVEDGWIPVPSRNLTRVEYWNNNAVDNSTNKVS